MKANTTQADSRLQPEPVGVYRPQHPLFLFAHGLDCIKESVDKLSANERVHAWELLRSKLGQMDTDGKFLRAVVEAVC